MKLSPTEEIVVKLLHQGKTNKEMAEIMNIKLKSVKFHISRLNMKLRTRNRLEIVKVTGDNRSSDLETLNRSLEQVIKDQAQVIDRLKRTLDSLTILPGRGL